MWKRCFISAVEGSRVGSERVAGRVVRGALMGCISSGVEGVDEEGAVKEGGALVWTRGFDAVVGGGLAL